MAALFQKFLLATEHSEHDVGSERIAMAMAQRCGVPLAAVLPILSNPEYEAVAPQLAMRAEALAAGRLAELNTLAASMDVDCQVEVRRGALLFKEIVDEARRLRSDLIIIRRRGKPGLLANLLVGEMVSQVLAHAPCSVLVAPRYAAMWSRHVVVALDPAAIDATALKQACGVATECGLPLTLVAVVDREGDLKAAHALGEALATARLSVPLAQAELLHGKAHLKVMEATRRLGADLIVVGRRGEGGFARAWIGGAAQKLIGLADCAVLVAVPGT
jgi:nucleotide-binding universal stress UspA family protein